MIATFSALTSPVCCAAASTGRTGSNATPSIDVRGPTASAARTRRAASRFGKTQRRGQHPAQVALTQHGGQVQPLCGGDGVVVDQRQLVPDPFVPLHELDQPHAVEVIEPAVADDLDQLIMGRDPGGEGVMDRRQLGRPRESHTQILLEHAFEYKSFPLQIRDCGFRG